MRGWGFGVARSRILWAARLKNYCSFRNCNPEKSVPSRRLQLERLSLSIEVEQLDVSARCKGGTIEYIAAARGEGRHTSVQDAELSGHGDIPDRFRGFPG